MTAIPMKLQDALSFNGFSIAQTDYAGGTLAVSTGTIIVPPMRLSSLVWERAGEPEPWDSFYLAAMPVFDDDYRPVILSHIIDRFADRRLSYDTPDKFGQAVRRWVNLNLGGMSSINKRYLSSAVNLPLTTQDATTATTDTEKARTARSDFPQGPLSGNLDYATNADDTVGTNTGLATYEGRMGVSVMALLEEQRLAFINADAELLDAMESLFLGIFDLDEREASYGAPINALGFLPSYPGLY